MQRRRLMWALVCLGMMLQATALAAPVVVKVGLLLSKTGTMADIGAEGEHGFEMAMQALKARFDNDKFKVEFFVADSRSAPDTAATAVNKLNNRDRVDVIVGDLTSTATLAAAPIAQRAGVPMLSPSSTSDKVTPIGDYIFRACYVDSFQGIAMANYAYDTLKARTTVLLVDLDMDHSRDVAQVFGDTFAKKGGKVLKTVSFSGSRDTSFVPQINELRLAKADVIYAPVYYTRMGPIFKQAKVFKVASKFLGTDAWDSPQLFKLAQGATTGALFTDPFSYQNPDPMVQRFRNLFKERYKVEPSSYGALAYDAMFVLHDALARGTWPMPAESMRKNIRDLLAATKDVAGVTGTIGLDAGRNVVKPNVVILKLTADGYDYHATYTNPT